MLSKVQNKREEGFTIIEVLIVLAIAGLILLIVFLAVPALQRNSRNTSIKNDVQNVLGGISEYQGANNGKMPAGAGAIAGTGTITYQDAGIATETQTTIQVQGSTTVSTITAAPATPPAGGTIQVRLGYRCDGSASSRAASAYYSIETASNSTVQQCSES